jgi:hypothetical protein
MFERERKFVVARMDARTLKARSEQVFDIPSLSSVVSNNWSLYGC